MSIAIASWIGIAGCAAAAAEPDQQTQAARQLSEDQSTDAVPAEMSSLPTPMVTPDPDAQPPTGAANQFATDFSLHTVDYSEVLSGGPPKDGIPAIDHPQYETVDQADEWLEPQEPVIHLEHGGVARAYPLQILTWHEIVNDEIDGLPVTVTFCPLCNTAIAFDRRIGGTVLDFGTTGRLRYSNLIMYDRQTESWWQQASGQAIAGQLTGAQLEFLPASMIPWSEFHDSYPEGSVLSRETGFTRSYGRNPYPGYDDVRRSPFLYIGPSTPDQLPAMARVLTLHLNGDAVAFPYEVLQERKAINASVGDEDIVVIWQPGTASALDTSDLAEGRDVGSAAAFSRVIDGQALTFEVDGSAIVDRETGTAWDVLGHAVAGELSGSSLSPLVAINHFWFSWAAFMPETRIYQP